MLLKVQGNQRDFVGRNFSELLAVAICMTFLDVVSWSVGKKSISYLSMGCGIFGRLNLGDDGVPLAEVLELMRTAQLLRER